MIDRAALRGADVNASASRWSRARAGPVGARWRGSEFSWLRVGSRSGGSFGVFFRGGTLGRPGFLHWFQEPAQFFLLFIALHLGLELVNLLLESLLVRVDFVLRPAPGLVLQRRQQCSQGPLFPLVILLAADAQAPGCRRGRQLTGADFEDQFGSLAGFAIHLAGFWRLVRTGGNLLLLDLFEPAGQTREVLLRLVVLEQGLQPGRQRLALAEVDPGLEGLEHALHGPALPVVEGDPGDAQLAADFRWFAALGPDGQHRLHFVLGTVLKEGVVLLVWLVVAVRSFVG